MGNIFFSNFLIKYFLIVLIKYIFLSLTEKNEAICNIHQALDVESVKGSIQSAPSMFVNSASDP